MLFSSGRGSCHSRISGTCLFEGGFGFYIDDFDLKPGENTVIEKYLEVEGLFEIRRVVRERIIDDLQKQTPYDQSFVHAMRQAGHMDATNSYEEVDGERLPMTDESKYEKLLSAYRSPPEDSIRAKISEHLQVNLFSPLGLSSDYTTRSPTPVSVIFQTSQPIYPLKISSINGGETEVLLYTLSDSYFSATGLDLEYAGESSQDELKESALKDLSKQWSGLSKLTKLRGTFRADEMTSDIILEPKQEQRQYRLLIFEDGLQSWLFTLFFSMVTIYLWGLAMSAIARKIINKISKLRSALGEYTTFSLFTYPVFGVILIGLLALFEVMGFSVQPINLLMFFVYFVPPILSTILFFIVVYLLHNFFKKFLKSVK